MENLDQKEWLEGTRNEDAVIIDVRTAEECEEGMVPNARQLDIYRADEFMAALNDLDTQKEYYLYCRSGARSGQACMILRSKGFSKVYNLTGGMLEWEGELETP